MELFIPSLVGIVLAALVVMFILPRLSPIILGVLALVFLVLAAYQHFTFFGNEYALSTWQLPLVNYGPYLLLGGLIIFLILFIVNFIGTGSTDVTAPIQKMNEAVDRVVEQAPTFEDAKQGVAAATNNALKAVGLGGPNNNRPVNRPANRPNFPPAPNAGPNAGRIPNGPRFSRI